MRYREGQEPSPEFPYGKSTHYAQDFSMLLGIVFGIVLLWMGFRSGMMWLKVWSVGLVGLAVYFLGQRYLL